MDKDRFRNIKREYDLIIVGGGIHGATLLWEATLRELSVILIEKDDFCSATSANSLKIIHGGLRYLQNFNFKRVRQSSNELKILMSMAPHLVQPLPCIIPTSKRLKRSKIAFRMALKSHDLLCRDRNPKVELENNLPSGQVFSIDQFRKAIPHLELSDITGGAVWYDALNFNSERLVVDFITSAARRGADAYNYVEGCDLLIRNGRAIGIKAFDHLSNQNLEILGKLVVNATGPWINKLNRQNPSEQNKNQIVFAKAVNIIVQRSLSNFAFGLETNESVDDLFPAKRFLFFVPWRNSTIIGTWYFENISSPEFLTLCENELKCCIKQIQKVFPAANITKNAIQFIHLGLVPVDPRKDIKKFKLREQHSIIDHKLYGGPDNLISVSGVKYTTARNVAFNTVKFVSRKLKKNINRSILAKPLDGGNFENFEKFFQTKKASDAHRLNERTIQHLILNYGSKYDEIVGLIAEDNELGQLVPGSDEAIQAELLYCLKNDYTYHLSDLLLRRTDIGSLGKPNEETINFCAEFMARELGWTLEKKQNQINSYLKYYDRLSEN